MTTGGTDLASRLRAMPKVELHVHLEGAQAPETIWEMARRNDVALPAPTLEAWRAFYQFRDFAHFIEVYIAASRCMRTAADFEAMTVAFHATQAAQQVVYTEAFLSASLFVDRIPWPELLAALRRGCEEGRERHGVTVRFIPDIARNVPDTQRRVLDFTLAGQREGVCIGLGLGGLEDGYPPELFTDVFAEARRSGLRVVAHAGEAAGSASVRGAVEALQAERIGHGIRCLEDADTVALLRERRIPIEVCPISNFRTGVVATGAVHPIHRMVAEGLWCTVNSDDPPMFDTTLTGEYLALAEAGMDWDTLWRLNVAAVEAAFVTPEEREGLRARLGAFADGLPVGP